MLVVEEPEASVVEFELGRRWHGVGDFITEFETEDYLAGIVYGVIVSTRFGSLERWKRMMQAYRLLLSIEIAGILRHHRVLSRFLGGPWALYRCQQQ